MAQEIEGCLCETRKLHLGFFIKYTFETLFRASEKEDEESKPS